MDGTLSDVRACAKDAGASLDEMAAFVSGL